jgi:dynein heavy chain
VTCSEATVVLAKYDHLMDLLDKFESKIFASWAASVAEHCERNLKHSLLTRNAVNKELSLNFHPEVSCFIALHFIVYVMLNSIICC